MHDRSNLRNHSEKDRILFGLLPEIECEENCSACCDKTLGFVLNEKGGGSYLSREPYRQYEFGAMDIFLLEKTCENLKDGLCDHFVDRPFICRIFWKREEDGSCFAGRKPERTLTHEELRRILWCYDWGTLQDAQALRAWMKEGKI